MSDRERWIVYPLLFYALVMGFKSTYQDPMEFRCRTIECQSLKVQSINGSDARAVSLLRNQPANVIVVPASPGSLSVDQAPTAGTATREPVLDNHASESSALETNEAGTIAETADAVDAPAIETQGTDDDAGRAGR